VQWTRLAGALVLLAALALYYAFAERLPELPRWGEVVFLAVVLLPAAFLLVWILLPLWRSGTWRIGAAALALGVLTLALELLELEVAANFTKLAAVTAAGWWFLAFFEAVSWVLLVALLIVPVDIFSVATGPTKHIVEEQPDLFDVLSVGFPIPGIHATARLGLPDILFFALFLAAAARFDLRVGWTWVAMVLSFGATLAGTVWLDTGGLPALPLLSAAFVLANADLLWRSFRARGGNDPGPPPD
jgi:hypothetical protein